MSEELDGNLKVYDEKGLAVAGTGFGIHVFNDNSGSIHLDNFNSSNTGNNVKLLRNINFEGARLSNDASDVTFLPILWANTLDLNSKWENATQGSTSGTQATYGLGKDSSGKAICQGRFDSDASSTRLDMCLNWVAAKDGIVLNIKLKNPTFDKNITE